MAASVKSKISDGSSKVASSSMKLSETKQVFERSRVGVKAMDPQLIATSNRLNESLKKLHISNYEK